MNIEGVQDFFLTLSRDSWCPGVAEFDTRVARAGVGNPGVELGDIRISRFCFAHQPQGIAAWSSRLAPLVWAHLHDARSGSKGQHGSE